MSSQPSKSYSSLDSSLRWRVEHQGTRLHIVMGARCNNNCQFCMEDRRDERLALLKPMTPETLRTALQDVRGIEEVCFTSGEPTLHTQLPTLIREARNYGVGYVSVMTNGRRLAYRAYLAQLVKSGMNRVYISIHGHHAKLHDSLTRARDSFEQTWQGVVNSCSLSRHLEVRTSTVVVRRNLPYLLSIYEKLSHQGVAHVVFNALQIDGNAATYFKRLMPPYHQVREQFERVLHEAHDGGSRAYLVDVPPCVTEGLPEQRRGFVENRLLVGLDGRSNGQGRYRKGTDSTELHMETSKEALGWMRVYREACESCKYRGICEGVYRRYIDEYGWGEFVPVREG